MITAALALAIAAHAAPAAEPAAWIAPPEAGPAFNPPRLRRAFTLADKPSAAKVRVVGLGHYELRCNGKIVGDSVINQAWSQYDKTLYTQEFDLAPYLVKGDNVLAATLGDSFWSVRPVNDPGRFSKTDAMPDFSAGRPYLLWIDGSAKVGDAEVPIVTDASWSVGPSPLRFCHIYGGEDFDARLDAPGWDTAAFTTPAAWRPAAVVPAPKGALVPLPSPTIKTFEVFAPTEIKQVDDHTFTYVFPQNCSSLLRFTVEGASGEKIRMRPCEYMQPDGRVKFTYTWGTGKDIWHDYTLSGSGKEQHQTLFCYVGAQFVQVEGAVPAGRPNPDHLPVLHGLELVHTRAACPEVGTFTSDSRIQNGAERLIDWSIRSNMCWVPTDCPHREKNGWLEQDWHMARAMSYRYDIHDWFTKVARDIRDAQFSVAGGSGDDGFVPTNAPWYLVGRPVHDTYNDAPEWGVSAVLVPWHLYEWYGDKTVLETNFDSMKRFVDYLSRTAKDGVITSHLGDWYDYGHGKGDGPSQWTPNEVSATAIWALAASTVADAAKVLGREKDEAEYRARFEAIRATFVAKFYDAAARTVKNGGSCQAANSTALCAGLLPIADRSAVIAAVIADLKARGWQQTAGEVLQVFLVRALAEFGGVDGADALHHVYAREAPGSYGYMVNSGLTTLPESWDAKPGTGNSMTHLMLGHLMEWHYAYVAGIRQVPGTVGWTQFLFAPQIPPSGSEARKALTSAQASFDSPVGRITGGWKIEGNKIIFTCEVPAGAQAAQVILPDGTSRAMVPGRNSFSRPAR